MTRKRSIPLFIRAGSVLALLLVIAGCTKGGQFDPTDFFNSDEFDSKKKLQGQREPVFPAGVPGTTTGVPPDLVKGYQAPPDKSADSSALAAPPPAAEKPKPKPKPKIARAPRPPRTRIDVSSRPGAPAQQPSAASSDPAWSTASAPPQQSSDPAWPSASAAPQQSAPPPWPTPSAPPQQTAQPAQSIWPNPPGAGTATRRALPLMLLPDSDEVFVE